MEQTIKAIETHYKGYRFRSRLEARWAVFFDALGLAWEYEPEGFDLGEAGWYLPDFKMNTGYGDWYLEIKPTGDASDEVASKAVRLSEMFPVAVLIGTPTMPKVERLMPPIYTEGQENIPYLSGSYALMFGVRRPMLKDEPAVFLRKPDCRRWAWHQRMDDKSIILWPVPAYEIVGFQFDRDWDESMLGDSFDQLTIPGPKGKGTLTVENPLLTGKKSIDSPDLKRAYAAARSARFEHGERPDA